MVLGRRASARRARRRHRRSPEGRADHRDAERARRERHRACVADQGSEKLTPAAHLAGDEEVHELIVVGCGRENLTYIVGGELLRQRHDKLSARFGASITSSTCELSDHFIDEGTARMCGRSVGLLRPRRGRGALGGSRPSVRCLCPGRSPTLEPLGLVACQGGQRTDRLPVSAPRGLAAACASMKPDGAGRPRTSGQRRAPRRTVTALFSRKSIVTAERPATGCSAPRALTTGRAAPRDPAGAHGRRVRSGSRRTVSSRRRSRNPSQPGGNPARVV